MTARKFTGWTMKDIKDSLRTRPLHVCPLCKREFRYRQDLSYHRCAAKRAKKLLDQPEE